MKEKLLSVTSNIFQLTIDKLYFMKIYLVEKSFWMVLLNVHMWFLIMQILVLAMVAHSSLIFLVLVRIL